MKVIESESERVKVLTDLIEDQSKLLAWQVNSNGTRSIYYIVMQSYHLQSGLVHFQSEKNFNLTLPLYFYSANKKIIFKSEVLTSSCVKMPSEIKLLDDKEIEVLLKGLDLKVKSLNERSPRDQAFLQEELQLMSVDEEDKLYADKRESPRVRPKADRWVKIRKRNETRIDLCRLFDLSRGGLGFLSVSLIDYPKGSEVLIIGFDDFDLDDPLYGEIVSQRPIDESKVDYKIGLKFIDGQA